MPDVRKVYQSEFLRAEQLGGKTRSVVIEGAVTETIGQGERAAQKIILKFNAARQRLPLNKTNAEIISGKWGPLTDHWIGKKIELRPDKVRFSGNLVDCIRVAIPPQDDDPEVAVPAAPAPERPDGGLAELADDLPWTAADQG